MENYGLSIVHSFLLLLFAGAGMFQLIVKLFIRLEQLIKAYRAETARSITVIGIEALNLFLFATIALGFVAAVLFLAIQIARQQLSALFG